MRVKYAILTARQPVLFALETNLEFVSGFAVIVVLAIIAVLVVFVILGIHIFRVVGYCTILATEFFAVFNAVWDRIFKITRIQIYKSPSCMAWSSTFHASSGCGGGIIAAGRESKTKLNDVVRTTEHGFLALRSRANNNLIPKDTPTL
ncbi:hypothetical protein P153DRAFT_358134 [Dothidotthia symphoricarpi CBS 119687]|uniref:Uncharacterized protein n=1 Tax=Dothidotthia symphoricarpi CBS 119687 TaxID=1392245 RepID=A0A6A6AAU9_9PLEO|nr:uncharacterized protein P153DRAFT_358134 [Dothidotthia symphoricarpi CBS 119687]KAF2127987.1 hypothetical protein P153DRAFT_358134 [Dothidotthia symphoricarpi CBS 119687]